jgi:hypothetical protein
MRSRPPTAYAVLPATWVEALARDYREDGYRVEVGFTSKNETFLRVHGLPREELWRRINDPLGEPGKQQTRHPTSGSHRRKSRQPTPFEQAWIEEERRYLKPNDDPEEREILDAYLSLKAGTV